MLGFEPRTTETQNQHSTIELHPGATNERGTKLHLLTIKYKI
jgi:hypothetical protein